MADPINADPAAPNPGGGGAIDPNASVKKEREDLVAEIKALRKDKQDLLQQNIPTAEIDKKIADALRAKELDESHKNWEKAQEEFLKKHKEFLPENDPGGLKKAFFDKELKFLNRDGLTSIDDLTSILERARVLAQATPSQFAPVRIDPSLPRTDPSPRAVDENNLSPKEQRMVAALGWTPERFLKLKAKDPGFVERALLNSPTI